MNKMLLAATIAAVAMSAHAGFPVVYDPNIGTPRQSELMVPIKFTGTERCTGTRRAVKVRLAGEIELSGLPVHGLTGTNAANGLDFHEQSVGIGAAIQLSGRGRQYGRVFYESAGATLQATRRRVTDYFSGVVTGGEDKLYGIVLYDYTKKSREKISTSKFAVAGVVNTIAYKSDTYHHLIGEAWLSSADGACRIHGTFKQTRIVK